MTSTITEEFIIRSAPRQAHNIGAGQNYPNTHPFIYDIYHDRSGFKGYLISKTEEHPIGDTITISVVKLQNAVAGANPKVAAKTPYYLDLSPVPTAPRLRKIFPNVLAPSSVMINSNVNIMVKSIQSDGGMRADISGVIDYLDPARKDLPDALKPVFREGTPITVRTVVPVEQFTVGCPFIFSKLNCLFESNGEIFGYDPRMIDQIPGTSAYQAAQALAAGRALKSGMNP